MKVLIIDDEPQIRKLLQTGLEGYGCEVHVEADGTAGLAAIARYRPDMVILDIAFITPPDGLEILHQLRTWSQIPVLMLSVRDDEKLKVAALHAGADDYLTKPFSMDELYARIEAILRRSIVSRENIPNAEIRVKGLYIDLVNRRVTLDGELLHFTPKEYELLCILATHPGKVVTHGTLLYNIWGDDQEGKDHYIRVFVNQIRKKLKENPARGQRFIISEPGVGYRFVDTD
jgi:two-component system KDP operon response regulator KdpE